MGGKRLGAGARLLGQVDLGARADGAAGIRLNGAAFGPLDRDSPGSNGASLGSVEQNVRGARVLVQAGT